MQTTCALAQAGEERLTQHLTLTDRLRMQGDVPLHWPLINSDHMRTKLAKRELEKKKIEDAQRCVAGQALNLGSSASCIAQQLGYSALP